MPHLVKLCVLGSTGVGKTSLVQQFVDNQFERQHRPTKQTGDTHHFSLIMNSNLIHVRIIDMPMISYFPTNTYYEWTDYRECALRSANGYLLVFDLTSPGSFHYIKVIREQLFESRNMQNIPVWIVANKADLCMNVLANMRGHREHHHHHHHHYHLHHHSTHEDLTPAFKDLANLVKKQWKSSYIECSAKYNWRVTPIFRDIIKTIENTITNDYSNQSHSHHHTQPSSSSSFGHHLHRDHKEHKDHKDHSDHSDSIKVSTGTHSTHSTHTGHSGAVQINLNNPTSNENARTCVIL